MADPGVTAPMHKDKKATLPRVQNYISSQRFKEVNLIDRLYPDSKTAELSYWTVPGGEGAWEEWTFDQVIKNTFTPTTVGTAFGPTWSTHWFKVKLTFPSSWKNKEVRFRWDSQSEATLWSEQGVVLQGLSSSETDQIRTDYVLYSSYTASPTTLTIYVEMAGNRMIGTNNGDLIDPPPDDLTFTVVRAEAAVMDTAVYKLTRDLEVLGQIAEEKDGQTIGYTALFTANQMVNSIIGGDDQTASDLADLYFSKGNGTRAHNLSAIGNCHIDSAWLWPYSETKRKVARSFSSQLVLMDMYSDYKFVASQAQQWAWCKQYYPELFARIKDQVTNGKFLPVGSTWVEMDGNIPSGESFVRQFLHGQRWYEQELGVRCKEYWLPDTFGYSPQIPGIMRHVDLGRFLTQKMSWSFVNKFPHHNFTWEGIDGSKVLAHFPPGDSYGMNVTVKEACYTESNLQDKGRVSTSAFLYGYGDGGGGPTQDMVERANRMADVDGVPRVQKVTPDEMFATLEKEQHNFCQWTGELYLELHNGTYTTHAAMKRLCREAEFKFRDSEFLLCMATSATYSPAADFLSTSLAELDGAWKKVLLNQFHDVLPGSGISMVYEDATQLYQEALASAVQVWDGSLAVIFGEATGSQGTVFNTLQWDRREVIKSSSEAATCNGEADKVGASSYTLVAAPAFGYSTTESVTPNNPVTLTKSGDNFILSNGLVRAVVSPLGQVTSLTTGDADARDVFRSGDGSQLFGNKILIFDNEPLYWDAWDVMDYHLETETSMNSKSVKTSVSVTEEDAVRVSLSWGCDVGRTSSLTQEIILTADCPYITFKTTVDWSEDRKMLKVGFDTGIKTPYASYDTQFGVLQRPTAVNTSWDSARYEVCGHKFADMSDTGFGVAVLNDSKYGWSGRHSSLTLTLLKSPKAPDATADMGQHTFSYALMPHDGTMEQANVMRRAYEFNNPLAYTALPSSAVPPKTTKSWGSVEGAGVVLHTIKPAEDGSGDLVLRFFESGGTRSTVNVKLSLDVASVKQCNGLEDAGDAVPFTKADGVTTIPVTLTRYAIFALRLSF